VREGESEGGRGTWNTGDLQRKGPVGLGESVDYVGAGCGEDVVNCVGGGDDAAAAAGGSVASLPGDDVACFLGVESL
jgi:hypothetical protein